MFVVASAILSCAPGVTTCYDPDVVLRLISSFVIVALVVSAALLINRGTRE